MSRLGLLAVAVSCAVVLSAGGCLADRKAKKLLAEPRMSRGMTLVLPGIEGKGYLNRQIRDGLADGGVPTAIRIYDWTLGPFMALVNLTVENRARREAQALAGVISAYKAKYPERPVFLVAHSGGCAVALFAAESLPPGQSVDCIVMLGPSVSPDYDLAEALKHVSGKAINYYSTKDRGFLGVGTWIFGTMDGTHSSSAGRVRFNMPANGSPEAAGQYRKLEQVPWNPSMKLSGNEGGHTDWADQRFVRDYIAVRLNRQMREIARATDLARAQAVARAADLAATQAASQATRPSPGSQPQTPSFVARPAPASGPASPATRPAATQPATPGDARTPAPRR